MRKFLHSKIHRATITHADLEYEGSLTIPAQLMQAANIKDFEAIQVWNVTRGTRLETYAITGKDNKTICSNGAAAHLMQKGDMIIIAAFCFLNSDEINKHKAKLVFVDENNQIKDISEEIAGPAKRS